MVRAWTESFIVQLGITTPAISSPQVRSLLATNCISSAYSCIHTNITRIGAILDYTQDVFQHAHRDPVPGGWH